jgi:hypothetical protein
MEWGDDGRDVIPLRLKALSSPLAERGKKISFRHTRVLLAALATIRQCPGRFAAREL